MTFETNLEVNIAFFKKKGNNFMFKDGVTNR